MINVQPEQIPTFLLVPPAVKWIRRGSNLMITDYTCLASTCIYFSI